MTDITELAQLRAELSNPVIGSKDHLRKIALSLVEALEKAQETIAFQQGEIKALLSSLESRAVKLPPKIERNDIDGWFMYKGGRVGGGAAEWYNKALDDVGAELTAAGIKVEAE
ncbi:hypothetical protein [Klebsiella pneumoniae]|uniref:hypothetical protein n=1 Tax=Klebsiella pneumoniae TaxID=573 RepID=UPI0030EDD71A|nr:hypothetical protein [Klebsiella pneumoniae subsp. pneumoniae]